MKIFRLIFAGLILFFVIAVGVPSAFSDQNALMKKANQDYRDGKYEAAAKLYEELISERSSAELYYDLGNAYFRAGKTGLSVLNYERARRLAPRDRDVLSNLKHVQNTIEYEIKDNRPWFIRFFAKAISYYRVEECWVFGLLVYLLFMLWLFIRTILKNRPIWSTSCVVLLVLAVLSFVPVIGKYTLFGMRNQAVVTASKSEVRYGPSMSDRLAFRLVEGLIVQIVDEREDWYRIELRDGQSGWVLKSEVTAV